MADDFPAAQEVLDQLPRTVFIAEAVMFSEITNENDDIEFLRDQVAEDGDVMIPLTFVGMDYYTRDPGIVVVPVGVTRVLDVIDNFLASEEDT